MIAKYNGFCKVTKQQIIAGVTEIAKVNGVWQIAQTTRSTAQIPEGATCIWAWSNSDQDRWGDEIAVHFVAFADDDGEPVGKIWKMSSEKAARQYADELSEKTGLSVEIELFW